MDGPEPDERARVERWHAPSTAPCPPGRCRGFDRRFSVVRGARRPGAGFPAYVVTPRGATPRRTLFYLHGGGYVAPIDPFHVRYVTRLADGSAPAW